MNLCPHMKCNKTYLDKKGSLLYAFWIKTLYLIKLELKKIHHNLQGMKSKTRGGVFFMPFHL